MADRFRYYNQNYQHPNSTNPRVYINPNFNRNVTDASTISNHINMYVNPNFQHVQTHIQHNIVPQRNEVVTPRIHVNPNFIRTKIQVSSVSNNQSVRNNNSSATPSSRLANTFTYLVSTQQRLAVPELQAMPQGTTVTENKTISTPVVKTNTVKLNKYKLVSLNEVKRNLAIVKTVANKATVCTSNQCNSQQLKIKSKINSRSVQNSRFKLVKRNSLTTTLNSSSHRKVTSIRRISLTINKNSLNSSRQSKKYTRGALKKNNIPCPLFKKYGSCLRNVRGNCCYLHDTKHVAICRNFLKGVCHDKQCLLSHDMTDKKMPTCYFYLKGICTKEACPYLHVKLNDKTKICQDFVKGYCEKGDRCLYRHVNISADTGVKATTCKKQNQYFHKNEKKDKKHTNDGKDQIEKEKNKNEMDFFNDHRYFEESVNVEGTTQQYDLIKPTRCKLGILPSFIQL